MIYPPFKVKVGARYRVRKLKAGDILQYGEGTTYPIRTDSYVLGCENKIVTVGTAAIDNTVFESPDTDGYTLPASMLIPLLRIRRVR